MITPPSLLDLALSFQKALPARIRTYLVERGIPNYLIDLCLLGWNGKRITIPIFNREHQLTFLKLAKDPEDRSDSPKMLATPGSSAELYGWVRLSPQLRPKRVIICEGEFDRLVLEAQGFSAVTSTGGAGVFRRDWSYLFRSIPGVYICFDHDEAGRSGAQRVGRLIPHARIVELPANVAEGGDVTDFFVRLKRTKEDFLQLLQEAKPAPKEEPRRNHFVPMEPPRRPDDEVERLKSLVAIHDVVGQYVSLRHNGRYYTARCPFHEDRTPSLVVYAETQSFYCFGCHTYGDVISFLMRIEDLSFPEALNVLRRLAS